MPEKAGIQYAVASRFYHVVLLNNGLCRLRASGALTTDEMAARSRALFGRHCERSEAIHLSATKV
jgi:hypothetical protein